MGGAPEFAEPPSPPDVSLLLTPAQLLDLIKPLKRGVLADEGQQAEVEACCKALEALNPNPKALASPLVNGKWEVRGRQALGCALASACTSASALAAHTCASTRPHAQPLNKRLRRPARSPVARKRWLLTTCRSSHEHPLARFAPARALQLLYTTSASILGTSRPALLRPSGPIYQTIDAVAGKARNQETAPFFNTVCKHLAPGPPRAHTQALMHHRMRARARRSRPTSRPCPPTKWRCSSLNSRFLGSSPSRPPRALKARHTTLPPQRSCSACKQVKPSFNNSCTAAAHPFFLEKSPRARCARAGELAVTYLDEELRISRGDKGNLFVLKMVRRSPRVLKPC